MSGSRWSQRGAGCALTVSGAVSYVAPDVQSECAVGPRLVIFTICGRKERLSTLRLYCGDGPSLLASARNGHREAALVPRHHEIAQPAYTPRPARRTSAQAATGRAAAAHLALLLLPGEQGANGDCCCCCDCCCGCCVGGDDMNCGVGVCGGGGCCGGALPAPAFCCCCGQALYAAAYCCC